MLWAIVINCIVHNNNNIIIPYILKDYNFLDKESFLLLIFFIIVLIISLIMGQGKSRQPHPTYVDQQISRGFKSGAQKISGAGARAKGWISRGGGGGLEYPDTEKGITAKLCEIYKILTSPDKKCGMDTNCFNDFFLNLTTNTGKLRNILNICNPNSLCNKEMMSILGYIDFMTEKGLQQLNNSAYLVGLNEIIQKSNDGSGTFVKRSLENWFSKLNVNGKQYQCVPVQQQPQQRVQMGIPVAQQPTVIVAPIPALTQQQQQQQQQQPQQQPVVIPTQLPVSTTPSKKQLAQQKEQCFIHHNQKITEAQKQLSEAQKQLSEAQSKRQECHKPEYASSQHSLYSQGL